MTVAAQMAATFGSLRHVFVRVAVGAVLSQPVGHCVPKSPSIHWYWHAGPASHKKFSSGFEARMHRSCVSIAQFVGVVPVFTSRLQLTSRISLYAGASQITSQAAKESAVQSTEQSAVASQVPTRAGSAGASQFEFATTVLAALSLTQTTSRILSDAAVSHALGQADQVPATHEKVHAGRAGHWPVSAGLWLVQKDSSKETESHTPAVVYLQLPPSTQFVVSSHPGAQVLEAVIPSAVAGVVASRSHGGVCAAM